MDDRDSRQPSQAPRQRCLRLGLFRLTRDFCTRTDDSHGFVVDGEDRLLEGVEAVATEEVERLYASSLKNASPRERVRIQEEMRKAIEQRVRERMPPVSPQALF